MANVTKKKVGLIGWPAEQSVSPAMHNAAFADLGMADEWEYDLMPTAPNELAQRVQTLVERGYIGANVTVPHKQAIIPYVGSVVTAARGANAVNTLVYENGRFEGHNTDVYGVRADLEAHGISLKGIKALVMGAGGAAHAAVLALANAGASVTIVNRHSQRAWDLYRNVRRGVSSKYDVMVQERSALPKFIQSIELVINCTPAGMYPHYIDQSPWPDDVPFPSGIVAYDMVYRPEVTRFMQQAQETGSTAIGGLGMLVFQGAAAFQLWTGKDPNTDVMMQAAKDYLQAAEQS
jgi:shikimate dehydrogenase